MHQEEDIIFECQDQMYPDYKLKVVGDHANERMGVLNVYYKDKSIHEQPVNLSYGAIFGPDVMDIDAWGQIACQVVDHHREKHAGS